MSFIERSMENALEKKIKADVRNAGNTIGRPFGFGQHSGGRENQVEGINWQDYNYPPGIRLIHYNKAELPSAIADVTKFQKVFFELVVISCIVGVVNSLICASTASNYPAKYLFYCLLNCMILPPLALFVFYQGYRGMATSSASLLTQYKLMHGVATFLLLLFVFVPMGAINGFGRYGTESYKESAGAGYWGFAIFLESSLHLLNLCFSGVALVRVQQFNPYQTSNSGGTSI